MKKFKIFITIVLIVVLIYVWNRYQNGNMNIFTRAEMYRGTTEFSRDNEIKYSDSKSYKLKSDKFNDAMLYTKLDVEPNTVYRISCMVKTNNVVPQKVNGGAGASICITDTTEQSRVITGTEDWQLLEFMFNSKNRESVQIGFRLGGNGSECTGEAWFSDFKMEQGFADTSNEWNFVCFVFENLDVEIEENGQTERVQISMTNSEIEYMVSDIKRFETSCKTLSNGRMKANCDIFYIDEPITTMTYADEPGYYVSSFDVEPLIDKYIQNNDYDHIFSIIKLDNDKYRDSIEIHDWVGLGYMEYQGIGFSNIRVPTDSSKFMYIYDPTLNTFPEEVFVHEFLHSLERNSNEFGFETVDLHNYTYYGYKNESLTGLKKWYSAYMSETIYDSNLDQYIGLDESVYTLKPVHSEDFLYATELKKAFSEPKSIIEEIELLLKNVGINLNRIFNT